MQGTKKQELFVNTDGSLSFLMNPKFAIGIDKDDTSKLILTNKDKSLRMSRQLEILKFKELKVIDAKIDKTKGETETIKLRISNLEMGLSLGNFFSENHEAK